MRAIKNNSTAFLLEEVFQLLLESLDHDPFSQRKNRSSKSYLKRLRELLGQEFSFWLAETGNLYFSTLISAKGYADTFSRHSAKNDKNFKQVYDLLLHTSYLMMCVGPQSEQTINTLIKLDTFITDRNYTSGNISEVIESSVLHLQHCVCNEITV